MATVTLALPHKSETESVMVFTYVLRTPSSDSSLLIRFNDSTDFDELTKPVSPLHSFQVLRYFRKDEHN
ncbi:unnamed protein product [Brassica oleracea]